VRRHETDLETNKLPGYMETFQFYKDEKMTIWYRGKFEVEANSEEEAIEMVKELEKTNKLDNYDVYWEILDDTMEGLTVEDNGGYSTGEIYTGSGNMIWDNSKIN
jgi:hypothetical protein